MKKMKRNNSGATLLFVIVAMTVMAIMGMMIIAMTVTNYQMVTSDKLTRNNFYSTESVITEVKSGIQEEVGNVAKAAYEYVLENYSEIRKDPTLYGTVKEAYKKEFFNRLVSSLKDGGAYTIDWSSRNIVNLNFSLDKVKSYTRFPSAIKNDSSSNQMELDKMEDIVTLTIKDLQVHFVDSKGYSTTITTDMVFKAPDIQYNSMETFPEYTKYVLIGEDSINVGGTGTHTIGNLYAGINGLIVKTAASLKSNSEMIITRGDLVAKPTAELDVEGRYAGDASEIWTENIMTDTTNRQAMGDATTTINLNAKCYVSDDLLLSARNSRVSLSGEYYGYNYNETNDKSVTPKRAQFSSSMIVNAANSMLNLNGINALTLAGRAFISRNQDEGVAAVDDIMTGESIAMKSNQVAYLVPEEYISVGHNPVFKSELDRLDASALSNLISIPAGEPILNYLDTEPYTAYYHTLGSSVQYVYYYLNFKSSQAANEFFENYYNSPENQNKLRQKANVYVANMTTDCKIGASNPLVAGYILNYSNQGSDISTLRDNAQVGDEGTINTSLCINRATEYKSRQLSLVSGKSTDFRWATGKGEAPLFDVLVDRTKFDAASGTSTFNIGGIEYQLVVTRENYIVGSNFKGLIVSGGDVTVTSNDFKGLIIADGVITTSSNNTTLTADESAIRQLIVQAAGMEQYKDFFKGVSELAESGEGNVNIGDCITYMNWRKN